MFGRRVGPARRKLVELAPLGGIASGIGAVGTLAFKAQQYVRDKRHKRHRQVQRLMGRFYDRGPHDTTQSLAEQEAKLSSLDLRSHRALQDFEASLRAADQAAKSAAYWKCVVAKVGWPVSPVS